MTLPGSPTALAPPCLQASSSLQEELESLHHQSKIWKSGTDEQDKLKQENQLLRSQLQTR